MYNCMYSVFEMEVAFKNMITNHREELQKKAIDKQKAAIAVINNRNFWRDLEVLTPVAKPFNQVCQAMQGRDSSLADCFRYFILLARTLKAAEANTVIDPGFIAWAFTAFNMRYKDMADPVTRLALFLHPGHRLVGNQEEEWETFKMAVPSRWQLVSLHRRGSMAATR